MDRERRIFQATRVSENVAHHLTAQGHQTLRALLVRQHSGPERLVSDNAPRPLLVIDAALARVLVAWHHPPPNRADPRPGRVALGAAGSR